MSANNYHYYNRLFGPVWLHKSKDAWIVFYPFPNSKSYEFYYAYQAVNHVPRGREPWTIDNKRIGTKDGFRTLEDAMKAIEAI